MIVGAQVTHPVRLVAQHGHQVAVTLVGDDNYGKRDLPPGLAASNLDCGSLVGSDARCKGDAEQAAHYACRPVWTPGAELPPLKRAHSTAPHHTSLPLPGTTGFVLASLTVIDLSVRADVSRADMVVACLVTRVGMGL